MLNSKKSEKIVCITPCSIHNDMRTLKEALTFEQNGYDAEVVFGSLLGSDSIHCIKAGEYHNLTSNSKCTEGTFNNYIQRVADKYRPLKFIASICKLFVRNYVVFTKLSKSKLYIIHSYIDFPAVYLKAKIYRSKIVYNAHDAHYLQYLLESRTTTEKVIGYFFHLIEKALMKNADQVWTVCNHVAGLLNQKYNVTPKIIRNCYDKRLSKSAPEDIRSKFAIKGDDIAIAVIGNNKPGQAIEAFIKGISQTSDNVHVIFIGAGYEAHQSVISSAGIAHRVHLLGQVNAEYVVPYAEQCDLAAVIYFPYNENYRGALPNGFFQSISAKLPLIYPSTLVELEALGREYDFGLAIDSTQTQEYVLAVQKLQNNPKLWAEYKKNTIRAAEEISWAREEEKVLEEVDFLLHS